MDEDKSPVKVAALTQPTDKDIEGHDVIHSPFRNWCKKCVEGQGMPARTTKFHMDFMFLEPKEAAGQTMACSSHDVETKMTMAAAVPHKTTVFLHETVRSDQEPLDRSGSREVGRDSLSKTEKLARVSRTVRRRKLLSLYKGVLKLPLENFGGSRHRIGTQ